jgi:hypothetical protein
MARHRTPDLRLRRTNGGRVIWKCKKCGHTQPRHPETAQKEMPLCDQFHPEKSERSYSSGFRDHTGKYISEHGCGGEFEAA